MEFSLLQEVSKATEFGLKNVLHKVLQKCIYAMEKKAWRENKKSPSSITTVKIFLHYTHLQSLTASAE